MDAKIPARITYQDAINIMLSIMGEHPYSNATQESGEVTGDVAMAEKILGETSQAVQGEGWNFNLEKEYPLQPDANDKITIPPTVIRWYLTNDKDADRRYVQRGVYVYDRKEHTFTMTGELKPTVVWFLEFDDIPETAKRYIAIRAGRILQARTLTSQSVAAFTEAEELQARADMIENEGDSMQANFLDHPDVGLIAARYNNPRAGW